MCIGNNDGMTSSITIPVSSDVASAFAASSPEVRREIQSLVERRLKPNADACREVAIGRSLLLMEQIGREAEARGLTDEILEDLLRDER